MRSHGESTHYPIDISEADIIEAMKDVEGYIDISPGDFREIFLLAYRHALQRLTRSRTAGQIMTSPVLCIDASLDLQQTALLLAEKGVSGAPVIDSAGVLVGVVSEKDFLKVMGVGPEPTFMKIISHCLNNQGCMVSALRNHLVSEIMSTPPLCAGPGIRVSTLAELFTKRGINRLPIVDRQKRPVGIVTRSDLVCSQRYASGGGA